MQELLDFVVKYWVQWAMGLFAVSLVTLAKKFSAYNKGLRALLRDRLIQQHNYYIGKDCWPIYARDSMLDMHKQYQALGGNGAITSIINDLEDLPTEPKKERK